MAITKVANFILAIVRQYWKYRFRDVGMTFATLLIVTGATIILSGGVWKILIATELLGLPNEFVVDDNQFAGIGVVLLVAGLAVGLLRLVDLGKQLTGILIIHRGMEGMDVSDIKHSLPKSLGKGRLEIIDLCEGHQLYEGQLVHPERALDVVNGLRYQIQSRLNGRDISEVTLAYAGLAPIPLLVAAGYRITSRQKCIILDYSRTGQWHGLDDVDDAEGVIVSKPQADIEKDIAIVLPFSVDISEEHLPASLKGKACFIRLSGGARPDSLNSTEKQNRVAKMCYTIISNLKAEYVALEQVHVFIAAQASFAFRFGTMLTMSVMPPVNVYQYDASLGSYSWGIKISSGQAPAITQLK